MKMYKHSVIIAVLLLTAYSAICQQGSKSVELNYTVGIPTGNFKNLTDKTSFRGFEVAYLFGITDQISLGLQIGFQDFYQKYPRQTYSEPGYDLSAVITSSVQTVPIMLKAKYILSANGFLQPYASLAAGGNIISYEKYYGEFVDSKTSFGFAAQPELGIHIPFGKGKRSGFHVAAGYNYMPFTFNDANGLRHALVKAGVSIEVND